MIIGNAVLGNKDCEERKLGQVEQQMERLLKDVAGQNQEIDRLYSKLSSVIASRPEDGSTCTPVPCLVPLANSLRDMSESLTFNNSRLRTLAESIEL
jgi:hypothetical protein